MVSCNECTTCEPFLEEPILQIHFLNAADSTDRTIIIDSINQSAGEDVRQFQEAASQYNFPLDMHSDTSLFNLVYRDLDDTINIYRNSIVLTYSRKFYNRDDNYIIVECNLNSFESDFLRDKLSCPDSTNVECISYEATARIYN